jgi:hypothetical protein
VYGRIAIYPLNRVPREALKKVIELKNLVTRSRGDRGGPIAVLILHDLLRALRASA